MHPIERIVTICTGLRTPALMGCAILALSLWSGTASSSDAIQRALSLIDQKRYSQAHEVLEHEPNTPRLRLVQGILHAREGSRARAIEIFERLRSDHPEMVEAYNNLAVLYADQGRLEAARGVLVSALERRSDATLYANLGDVYMRLADRAYDRARKLSADDPGTSAEIRESASPAAAAGGAPMPLLAKEKAAKGPGFAASADGRCLRGERFKDRKAGAKAAEWLQLRGAEVLEIRREERQVEQSYWVRLSTPGGAKSARKTIRDLRRLGVRDVAVIAKSERPGTISLGVYRSKANMQRRVAELRKLGYKPISGANPTVLKEYVIKARPPGDRAALKDAWAKRFPDNPMRDVRCSGPK